MLVPWIIAAILSCSTPVILGFKVHVGSVGGCHGYTSSSPRQVMGFRRLHYRRVHVASGSRGSSRTGTGTNGNVLVKARRLLQAETSWTRKAVAIEGPETGNVDSSGHDPGEVEAMDDAEGWGAKPDDDISFAQMLKFILPTLGIWLASPILSLVDAGIVGTRSALELASLGPATVLCESLIYCSTFLAIATTNLQATALADGKKAEAQKVVAQALGLALVIGLFCAGGVQIVGPQVLAKLAGEKSREVVPAALVYSRIRILGAPASIGAMVLQAACLGARDSVTPLGVVITAGLVNALGDWFTVCRLGMGVLGAAAATASAETISMLLLGAAVWRAQGKRLYKFVAMPSWDELNVFLNFAGPIAFALIGKVICYSVMTLTCTTLGPIPLATHNVMLRVFFFFATFGEALSQTAQAFIPGQLARERGLKEAAEADPSIKQERKAPRLSPARRLMRKVLILGVGVGSLNACVAGLVPLHLPHLFTNSAVVTDGMRSLIPLLSWSLLTHACVMGLEGILLARRRLRFLAGCYAVNTVVMVGFMEYVKTWPISRGLQGAWLGLLLLQVLRLVEFGSHLLWLNRHERKTDTLSPTLA